MGRISSARLPLCVMVLTSAAILGFASTRALAQHHEERVSPAPSSNASPPPSGARTATPLSIPEGERYEAVRQMDSYSHDFKGEPLPGEAGKPRNVFKTNFGFVFAVTLEPNIFGTPYEEGLGITGWNNPAHAHCSRVDLSQSGEKRLECDGVNDTDAGLSGEVDCIVKVTQRFERSTVRVTVWDRTQRKAEVAELDVEDLYRWRNEKLRTRKALSLGDAGEFVEQRFTWWKLPAAEPIDFEGFRLFSVADLNGKKALVQPRFIVFTETAPHHAHDEDKTRHLAQRIAIGTTGYSVELKGETWTLVETPTVAVAGGDPAEAVYANAKEGVVKIEWKDAGSQSTGTGFVADATGLILTNRHVVEGAPGGEVTVIFADGTKVPGRVTSGHNRTVAGKEDHDHYDLAVVQLKAQAPVLHELHLTAGGVRVGQAAVAIGHPAGADWSQTPASIAYPDRVVGKEDETSLHAIELSAPVNPGNSGGPLLDMNGNVIGVIYMRREKTASGSVVQNMSYAIPAKMAIAMLDHYRGK